MEPETTWSSTSPMVRNLSSKRHLDSGFDGNRSDIVLQWFFPNTEWVGMSESLLDGLVRLTVQRGDLRWVLFPVQPVVEDAYEASY